MTGLGRSLAQQVLLVIDHAVGIVLQGKALPVVQAAWLAKLLWSQILLETCGVLRWSALHYRVFLLLEVGAFEIPDTPNKP